MTAAGFVPLSKLAVTLCEQVATRPRFLSAHLTGTCLLLRLSTGFLLTMQTEKPHLNSFAAGPKSPEEGTHRFQQRLARARGRERGVSWSL